MEATKFTRRINITITTKHAHLISIVIPITIVVVVMSSIVCTSTWGSALTGNVSHLLAVVTFPSSMGVAIVVTVVVVVVSTTATCISTRIVSITTEILALGVVEAILL